MGRYTKEDLWESPTCPKPEACSSLLNWPAESCEELSAITNWVTLHAHVRETGTKRHFHASANPWLSAADRAWAANNNPAHSSLEVLMRNPSLCTADLPDHEGWSRDFLGAALKRGDLVLREQVDFFAGLNSRSIWQPIVENGLDSELERTLLGKGPSFVSTLRAWANDERASVKYLTACLRLDLSTDGDWTRVIPLWDAVFGNWKTTVDMLITAPSLSDTFEKVLNVALEARADEASEWVRENYPEMSDVPVPWVRAVLAGVTDG